MKKKWKHLILTAVSIFIFIIIFVLSELETASGTQQGNFHFLKNDETGITFLYVPETENNY